MALSLRQNPISHSLPFAWCAVPKCHCALAECYRQAMSAPTIRAPRGDQLTCKGWPQEAAMRMLMNNLDPEVAERPEDLVVYGGTGKAARTWQDYHRIVAALQRLEADEDAERQYVQLTNDIVGYQRLDKRNNASEQAMNFYIESESN